MDPRMRHNWEHFDNYPKMSDSPLLRNMFTYPKSKETPRKKKEQVLSLVIPPTQNSNEIEHVSPGSTSTSLKV